MVSQLFLRWTRFMLLPSQQEAFGLTVEMTSEREHASVASFRLPAGSFATALLRELLGNNGVL
jgi:tRNA(Glu) U13 pseudouridine synthase TruD